MPEETIPDGPGYVAWARERLGDHADNYDSVVPLGQNFAGLERWIGQRGS